MSSSNRISPLDEAKRRLADIKNQVERLFDEQDQLRQQLPMMILQRHNEQFKLHFALQAANPQAIQTMPALDHNIELFKRTLPNQLQNIQTRLQQYTKQIRPLEILIDDLYYQQHALLAEKPKDMPTTKPKEVPAKKPLVIPTQNVPQTRIVKTIRPIPETHQKTAYILNTTFESLLCQDTRLEFFELILIVLGDFFLQSKHFRDKTCLDKVLQHSKLPIKGAIPNKRPQEELLAEIQAFLNTMDEIIYPCALKKDEYTHMAIELISTLYDNMPQQHFFAIAILKMAQSALLPLSYPVKTKNITNPLKLAVELYNKALDHLEEPSLDHPQHTASKLNSYAKGIICLVDATELFRQGGSSNETVDSLNLLANQLEKIGDRFSDCFDKDQEQTLSTSCRDLALCFYKHAALMTQTAGSPLKLNCHLSALLIQYEYSELTNPSAARYYQQMHQHMAIYRLSTLTSIRSDRQRHELNFYVNLCKPQTDPTIEEKSQHKRAKQGSPY